MRQRLPGAHFTGQLTGTHLATAFASLDAFVHPGESETFCQTVQEAQASGVPVVAAGSGGPRDLIDPGRTGLLYDPSTPPSLWRTVTALVRDEALRSRLACAALADVRAAPGRPRSRTSWTFTTAPSSPRHAARSPDFVRIVQLADFVGPTSGGMKTAIEQLGAGYVAAGAARLLIVPGPQDDRVSTAAGDVVQVRAPFVGGGYRLILEPWRVVDVLEGFAPTSLEISDKSTLVPVTR